MEYFLFKTWGVVNRMKILNFSCYCKDAAGLLQDSFQQTALQVTDAVVTLRELTKIGSITGFSSLLLNSRDPLVPLKWTCVLGVSCLASSLVANKLEKSALKLIAELREDHQSIIGSGKPVRIENKSHDSDRKMSDSEARACGLVE